MSPNSPNHPTNKTNHGSRSSELERLEKKRYQNRVAQRTYRRAQKERIRALEAAVARYSEAPLFSPSSLAIPNPRQHHDFVLSSTTKEEIQVPPPTAELSFASLLNASTEPFYHAPLDLCPSTLPTDPGSEISEELHLDWPVDHPAGANQVTAASISPDPGCKALHIAVDIGDESIVQLLLDKGADIHKQNGQGKTALAIAAERGHDRIANMLLDNSADPNTTDSAGRTPLFAAVTSESETMADLLLRHEALVNVRDQQGITPLQLAVATRSEFMTLLLLSKGADVDG